MREGKIKENKNGNEEDEDDRERKTTTKVYEPDSYNEPNEDVGISSHDDKTDNDNKENISR